MSMTSSKICATLSDDVKEAGTRSSDHMKKNISFNHNLLTNIRFKHSNCFIFDNSSGSMSTLELY